MLKMLHIRAICKGTLKGWNVQVFRTINQEYVVIFYKNGLCLDVLEPRSVETTLFIVTTLNIDNYTLCFVISSFISTSRSEINRLLLHNKKIICTFAKFL